MGLPILQQDSLRAQLGHLVRAQFGALGLTADETTIGRITDSVFSTIERMNSRPGETPITLTHIQTAQSHVTSAIAAMVPSNHATVERERIAQEAMDYSLRLGLTGHPGILAALVWGCSVTHARWGGSDRDNMAVACAIEARAREVRMIDSDSETVAPAVWQLPGAPGTRLLNPVVPTVEERPWWDIPVTPRPDINPFTGRRYEPADHEWRRVEGTDNDIRIRPDGTVEIRVRRGSQEAQDLIDAQKEFEEFFRDPPPPLVVRPPSQTLGPSREEMEREQLQREAREWRELRDTFSAFRLPGISQPPPAFIQGDEVRVGRLTMSRELARRLAERDGLQNFIREAIDEAVRQGRLRSEGLFSSAIPAEALAEELRTRGLRFNPYIFADALREIEREMAAQQPHNLLGPPPSRSSQLRTLTQRALGILMEGNPNDLSQALTDAQRRAEERERERLREEERRHEIDNNLLGDQPPPGQRQEDYPPPDPTAEDGHLVREHEERAAARAAQARRRMLIDRILRPNRFRRPGAELPPVRDGEWQGVSAPTATDRNLALAALSLPTNSRQYQEIVPTNLGGAGATATLTLAPASLEQPAPGSGAALQTAVLEEPPPRLVAPAAVA